MPSCLLLSSHGPAALEQSKRRKGGLLPLVAVPRYSNLKESQWLSIFSPSKTKKSDSLTDTEKRPDKTGNFKKKKTERKKRKSHSRFFIRKRHFFYLPNGSLCPSKTHITLTATASACGMVQSSSEFHRQQRAFILTTDAQSHSLSFIQRPAIHQCAHCCHEQRDRALSKSPLTQIWFTSICLKEWRARARSANTGWHLMLPTGMCLFSSVSNPGLMLKSDLLKDGIGLHRGWSYENELWSTMLLWKNVSRECSGKPVCVCACLHILAGKKWIFIEYGETENPALPLILKRVVLQEHREIKKRI